MHEANCVIAMERVNSFTKHVPVHKSNGDFHDGMNGPVIQELLTLRINISVMFKLKTNVASNLQPHNFVIFVVKVLRVAILTTEAKIKMVYAVV